mgnify:CR=1 FL=1
MIQQYGNPRTDLCVCSFRRIQTRGSQNPLKIYHVPFSKSKSGIMVYRILLEKRFIGFEIRNRPIRQTQCCAQQLKSFWEKTFFFLVFPFDLNMNAPLSCKRFGCTSFSQFKHVVFKFQIRNFGLPKFFGKGLFAFWFPCWRYACFLFRFTWKTDIAAIRAMSVFGMKLTVEFTG